MIGIIISAKCLDFLGVFPTVTIDTPTRLALTIAATEKHFNDVLKKLPKLWWVVSSTHTSHDRLKVEMIPIHRNYGAELDAQDNRIKTLEDAQ